MKNKYLVGSYYIDIIKISFLVVIGIILFVSCTSTVQIAEGALSSGDFEKAIESALLALQEEPGLVEAKQILNSAWTRANEQWESSIAQYEQEQDVWEMEKAFFLYYKLFDIHTLVKDAGRSGLNPVPADINERSQIIKDKIVEKHLLEGAKLIMSGTRNEALVALEHYMRAKEFDPEYPLIDNKIEKARETAMARVFVFTGPDTNITLNGIEMIDNIEKGLEQLDGVKVVRVPNRYAAPIDDNHRADEFAIGHKANLMLHVEPDTSYSVAVQKNSTVMSAAPWKRETLKLVALAETNIRYVLINLENDTIVSEGSFTVSDSDDGGFAVSAILHESLKKSINLGEGVEAKDVRVNLAPVGVTDITLAYKLDQNDNLDIPDYATGRSLNVPAATFGTGEKITLGNYDHPSELAKIADLQNHTFWLFDGVAYDTYGDGQLGFQLVYEQRFESGNEGHLTTGAYERALYKSIETWMRQEDIKKNMMDSFFPSFYKNTLPKEIVTKVSSLF